MYAAVLAALWSALGFMVRSILVKFVVFFALFFVTTGFIEVLSASGMLPTSASMTGLFGGIPASVWYFLNIFRFDVAVPLLLSAWVTRFIIRRIPVIG